MTGWADRQPTGRAYELGRQAAAGMAVMYEQARHSSCSGALARANRRHVGRACEHAGVTPGWLDARIPAWLSRGEPERCLRAGSPCGHSWAGRGGYVLELDPEGPGRAARDVPGPPLPGPGVPAGAEAVLVSGDRAIRTATAVVVVAVAGFAAIVSYSHIYNLVTAAGRLETTAGPAELCPQRIRR